VSGAGVRNADDIEQVLNEFAQETNGGFIVTPSPLTATRRDVIIETAARLRLPAIYPFRFYAVSGGLMSYGIDQTELVREAASYVDRILRGANPGELPVQLPTKYHLVININTAKMLASPCPAPCSCSLTRRLNRTMACPSIRLDGAERIRSSG
jgi:putative tryptophan/tyrosine transport system substrate-binding protein